MVEKLTKAGTIDQYRVEPFRKEMPGAMEEVEWRWRPSMR